MLTLCMDTSHKFLVVAFFDNDKLIANYEEECFKKQSENIFPALDEVCKKANVKPEDIKQVVISKGPGSYTGVRIAMTIAKVMCTTSNIPLYTIDTLKLYANNEDACVAIDARGKRVYFAHYASGELKGEEKAVYIEDIKNELNNVKVYGDGSLLGLQDNYPNITKAFINTKASWEKVENVHLLTPVYLKENDEYMVKKDA